MLCVLTVSCVQVSFVVAPSRASVISGGVVIPSAVSGILLGTFLVRRNDLGIMGGAESGWQHGLDGGSAAIVGIARLPITTNQNGTVGCVC
jgi:hypothetical protein